MVTATYSGELINVARKFWVLTTDGHKMVTRPQEVEKEVTGRIRLLQCGCWEGRVERKAIARHIHVQKPSYLA